MPILSSHSRMAPPVRPSRSLEGLERVIPPLSPQISIRSDLFLNKPLPAKPLPEEPECSAMWSDSSDTESTLDSGSERRHSVDSYPIFVSSGSDFDDLVDPSTPSEQLLTLSSQPHKRTDSIDINIPPSIVEPAVSDSSSSSDAPYGRPSHWAQSRTGINHYFREKKWDYFPELAPSSLHASGRISPNMVAPSSKSRKLGIPLDFAKGKCRWHSLDRGGLGGIRESIKTYVNRTLSRDSTAENKKEIPRPATAPTDHHLNYGGRLRHTAPTLHLSSLALDTGVAARATSVATSSSSEDDYTHHRFHLQTPIAPTSPTSISTPITSRPKQLAVPLSAYQKHGPVIWEPPKSQKPNAQFPRSASSPDAADEQSSSAPNLSYANATPALSPLREQSQYNTRGAFLGAKKKIAESKDDRRREQLKAQIKLVGPVNPQSYVQADPWI
ncbi:hypothetical protein Pdw03_5543 [Penicillium digitatum]|nr:hypothetical protein Pdw03_5543 [Penicillium digitatum]